MTRLLLRGAATVQMGLVWVTVVAWPALFIPAVFGLVIIVCAIPDGNE